MTDNSLRGPIEQWRGFDPAWGDVDYQTVLIEAPSDCVARELAALRNANWHSLDPFTEAQPLSCEGVAFVIQLQGHAFTQAFSYSDPVTQEEAKALSKRLASRCLFYGGYEDGLCFELYHDGQFEEGLSVGGAPEIYSGEVGQADLLRRRHEGWRISLDPFVEYFSRQQRWLDLASFDEYQGRFDQMLHELQAFIAWHPWCFENVACRCERVGPWRGEHFAAVHVVYHPPRPQRTARDEKLVIVENDPDFALLRRLLASEGDQRPS